MISEGLGERLGVGVGDSIVLLSQGYQGATAAGQFAVGGILHFPTPQMNDALVYLALRNAQTLFNAPHRLTSLVLMTGNADNTKAIKTALLPKIDSSLAVMTWQEMSPEILQSVQLNDGGAILTMAIFYIVIAFGVFGTVMMMTIERAREFGLLISLGMRRRRLVLVAALEAVLVSMIGAMTGLLVAMPVVLYFHFHPIHLWGELAKAYAAYGLEAIMSVNADASLFYSQVLVVFLIALVASLYPFFVIRKIRPVSALQGRGGMK
jgi:ABC-type lipoprotein release transport system permease subunit